MALMTCHECGAEVSTAAKSCPHCGARGKAFRGRRKLGLVPKVLLGFLGVGMIGAAVSEAIHPHEEQTAAQDAEHKATSERDTNIVTYARSLKAWVRNPDTLVYEHVRSNPDGKLVCFKIRAQNGFGGMDRQTIAFSPAGGTPDAFTVKTICHDKVMKDVTDSTLQLIKLMG